MGVKGHSPAKQHRLTHELSDISNIENGRADQAGEQELTDDPTTIVALLNVAGKLHRTSLTSLLTMGRMCQPDQHSVWKASGHANCYAYVHMVNAQLINVPSPIRVSEDTNRSA